MPRETKPLSNPHIVVSLLVAGLAACAGGPMQRGDILFNPVVANPAFSIGEGPVVAVDEAHSNYHRIGARYQAFACSPGVTRFHAGAVRVTEENFIGVFDDLGTSIGEAESQPLGFDRLPDEGSSHHGCSENRQISGGRILTGCRQSAGGFEDRIVHAQAAGALSHEAGECRYTAGVIPCETVGDVVAAANEHRAKQILFAINLT